MVSYNERNNFVKEQILIQNYSSTCALKKEIRDRIKNRSDLNWILCCIKSEGSMLSLNFKYCN